MKEASAAVGYVLFDKACEIDIDLLLLTFAILHILQSKISNYNKADHLAVINAAIQALEDYIKEGGPSAGSDFYRIGSQLYVASAMMKFLTKHATTNVIEFVLKRCQNEIKAVNDFQLMQATGFDDKDMLTVIESYLEA